MKKMFKFAFLSAIAFVGAVSFSACSSSDDMDESNNPNFNPKTNEVLTKFVFNVATGSTTRQTSAATQATSSDPFRGINNAVLLSFKQTVDGKHISAATNADKRYELLDIMSAGSIDQTKSHRVIETSLPLNTNSLLFYGKAVQTSPLNYEAYGHLDDFTIADPADPDAPGLDMSKTNIELGSRINGNLENYQKIQDLLAGVLTCIMNSNLVGANHTAVSYDQNSVVYSDNIYWSSYANSNGESPVTPTHDLYPLEDKLAKVYKEMTTIRDADGELRSGCAHNLNYTIQAMWSVINEIRYATPLCGEEAVAQALAVHIHNRLKSYFDSTVPDNGAAVTGVSFNSATVVINAFINDTAWPTSSQVTDPDAKPTSTYFDAIKEVNLNDFPEGLYKVPAGAAHYKFDASKQQFKYQQNYNTSAVGNGTFNVSSYYYPAELCYFGNSPVRTSSDQVRPNDYPDGVGNWSDATSWASNWSVTHVISSTKAVAMKNNINYGTSLLKTEIKYEGDTDGDNKVLYDNNHYIQWYKDNSITSGQEPNKKITITGTSFLLKGILIGGQSKKVGWDYLPKVVTAPETNPQGYIYDNTVASTSIPATGTSTPNYTLVFDNYNAQNAQDKVYVALELVNNTGEDFFGEHGLIRNGGTFYLVGQLDPADTAVGEPAWANSDHPLPPYDNDGNTIQVKRVFIQDYTTSVVFKIGPYSLQHAFLTVPDLRYSSLTLGLSVDLNWETGINFENVVVGGGEVTTH